MLIDHEKQSHEKLQRNNTKRKLVQWYEPRVIDTYT